MTDTKQTAAQPLDLGKLSEIACTLDGLGYPDFAQTVFSLIAQARTAQQTVGVPEGWEPVYLAWSETALAWVDVGLAEYEAEEKEDRRIAYQPKQGQ